MSKKKVEPKYTIDQKIKDLHKAIVQGDKETKDKLQKYMDFYNYGIK